jgi:hypothetical protein
MQAPVLRSFHHCEAMMIMFDPSHPHPMDRKLSQGLKTRPFEFGMQAPASRCSRRYEAMMVLFDPSHSHLDRKSSQGLMT